ncbi:MULTISPECIES: uridine kinase family protein [Deinococcus]|uniref:Uridine kinase n=1 Tax=Deinococcus rufus TaxID=2136097 RepID=A0ABV7Z868_9DEIO|nr:hypothetical protein [Deinococcus sp. AB2017081]WQE96387.1 hypothetical protein U2P90_05675 [Deinococcus sp. AB2017081]
MRSRSGAVVTPRVIAIAGGSASGKSTLTRRLRDLLGPGASVVALDEFFRTDRTHGPFVVSPVDGGRHFDLNHPDAFDVPAILARIDELSRDGQRVQFILIDGAFALAFDDLTERLHLKVFVWLDDDLRLGRKIARNFAERGTNPAITFQNYVNSGRPGHDLHVARTMSKADVILHGNNSPDDNARIVSTLIHHLQPEGFP